MGKFSTETIRKAATPEQVSELGENWACVQENWADNIPPTLVSEMWATTVVCGLCLSMLIIVNQVLSGGGGYASMGVVSVIILLLSLLAAKGVARTAMDWGFDKEARDGCILHLVAVGLAALIFTALIPLHLLPALSGSDVINVQPLRLQAIGVLLATLGGTAAVGASTALAVRRETPAPSDSTPSADLSPTDRVAKRYATGEIGEVGLERELNDAIEEEYGLPDATDDALGDDLHRITQDEQ